jgi:hypothetical protein
VGIYVLVVFQQRYRWGVKSISIYQVSVIFFASLSASLDRNNEDGKTIKMDTSHSYYCDIDLLRKFFDR